MAFISALHSVWRFTFKASLTGLSQYETGAGLVKMDPNRDDGM